MNVEVVKVGPADIPDWNHVVSWVYAHEAATSDSYPPNPGESRYLAKVSGTPAAACTVYPMDIARGTGTLRCGGVAGVGTLPEYRREGAADVLMRSVLEGMRDDGFAVSALYAFRSTYYRRFGYENCGWRWQIKCPSDRLPRLRGELPIRQLETSSLTELDDVYVPFVRARSGSPLRAQDDWVHRMGKKTPMVYGIGDPLEAYLWVNMGEFWGEVTVGEFAWTSRAGYEAGLSLMAGMCSNQLSIHWNEPPDSPFVASYMDQGITAQHLRPTMFRVVDVESALVGLKPDLSVEFTFRLVDEAAPWNDGTWTAVYTDAAAEVQRSTSEPAFTIEATRFSQALMGQPSLADLAQQGHVVVHDRAGFMAACTVLSPLPVVCMDFF